MCRYVYITRLIPLVLSLHLHVCHVIYWEFCGILHFFTDVCTHGIKEACIHIYLLEQVSCCSKFGNIQKICIWCQLFLNNQMAYFVGILPSGGPAYVTKLKQCMLISWSCKEKGIALSLTYFFWKNLAYTTRTVKFVSIFLRPAERFMLIYPSFDSNMTFTCFSCFSLNIS